MTQELQRFLWEMGDQVDSPDPRWQGGPKCFPSRKLAEESVEYLGDPFWVFPYTHHVVEVELPLASSGAVTVQTRWVIRRDDSEGKTVGFLTPLPEPPLNGIRGLVWKNPR